MSTIRLTGKNAAEQIARYGFFAEQLPPCFSSKGLAENLGSLFAMVDCTRKAAQASRKHTTAPTDISTYKNDISRRILSAPNPEAFLRVVKLYSDNWEKIVSFAKSKESLSPITYLRSYTEDGYVEEINSENLREARKARSDFIKGIKECIRAALGYQYRLKVDIANCYNSIYTHSITWAICGKDVAKAYYKSKGTATPKNADYELGDLIDAFTRFQKNNETNGIIVGPYTSRIFSEIILSGIDKLLREQGFVFKRYVDDYKFYFRSEAQAKEGVQMIEKTLNQFNLNLNLAKTEVLRFPYENVSNMRTAYDEAAEEDGIFGILNAAAQFYSRGEKGAYKYALKYIAKHPLDLGDFDLVFPLLVNIMMLNPKYGKYVIAFLEKNPTGVDTARLSEIANRELSQSLRRGLEQESLMFLYLIHNLELQISASNIIDVLRSQDDFSIIIALDIWKHHNSAVTRTKSEAKWINSAIRDLANDLVDEQYEGARWLLLHETEMHKLLPPGVYTPKPRGNFFQLLYDKGISFYEG